MRSRRKRMVSDGEIKLVRSLTSVMCCFICFMGFQSAWVLGLPCHPRILSAGGAASKRLQFYFLLLDSYFLWSWMQMIAWDNKSPNKRRRRHKASSLKKGKDLYQWPQLDIQFDIWTVSSKIWSLLCFCLMLRPVASPIRKQRNMIQR